MSKLKALIIFLLLVSLLLIPSPTAFTEDITLTTYYPAPFGMYEEVRSNRMAIGRNYMNSSAVTVADDNLIVEGDVGIGIIAPTEKLDVAGNIKASGTVCDGVGMCIKNFNLPTAACGANQVLTFNGISFLCKNFATPPTPPGLPPQTCDPNLCNGVCDSGNGTWECQGGSCVCATHH